MKTLFLIFKNFSKAGVFVMLSVATTIGFAQNTPANPTPSPYPAPSPFPVPNPSPNPTVTPTPTVTVPPPIATPNRMQPERNPFPLGPQDTIFRNPQPQDNMQLNNTDTLGPNKRENR